MSEKVWGYETVLLVDIDTPVFQCNDCGGLVMDQEAHNRFHAVLAHYEPVEE